MKVGQIPYSRGMRAIANQEPGYKRLFACRSLICPRCGSEDHGLPEFITDEPVRRLDRRLCRSCGQPVTRPRVRPLHCSFCDTHIYERGIDTHFHLKAF